MKTSLLLICLFFIENIQAQFSKSIFPFANQSHSNRYQSLMTKNGENYFYAAAFRRTINATKLTYGEFNAHGDMLSYDSLNLSHSIDITASSISALIAKSIDTVILALQTTTTTGRNLFLYKLVPGLSDPIVNMSGYSLPITGSYSEGVVHDGSLIHYVLRSNGLFRLSVNMTTFAINADELVDASVVGSGTGSLNSSDISTIVIGSQEYVYYKSAPLDILYKRTSPTNYQSSTTLSTIGSPVLAKNNANELLVHYTSSSGVFVSTYSPSLLPTGTIALVGAVAGLTTTYHSFFNNGNGYYRTIDNTSIEKYDVNFSLLQTTSTPYNSYRRNLCETDLIFGGTYTGFVENLVVGSGLVGLPLSFFSLFSTTATPVCEDYFTSFITDSLIANVSDRGLEMQGANGIGAGLKLVPTPSSKINVLYSSRFYACGFGGGPMFTTSGNNDRLGPHTTPSQYDALQENKYNDGFFVSKEMIITHLTHLQNGTPNYRAPNGIHSWPGNGNILLGQAEQLAPFADINSNGVYEPYLGDYPRIYGDRCVFSIVHSDQQNEGIEKHKYVYSFDCDDIASNNVLFVKRELYARTNAFDSIRTGLYYDLDLGNPSDDLVGTHVENSLIYVNNGDNNDETNVSSIGFGLNIPSLGIALLKGIKVSVDGLDNNEGVSFNQSPNGFGFNDGSIDNEFLGLETSNAMHTFESSSTIYNMLAGLEAGGVPRLYNGVPNRYEFPGLTDTLFYGSNGVSNINPECWWPLDYRVSAGFGSTPLALNEKLVFDYAYIAAYATGSNSNINSKTKLFTATDLLRKAYQNNLIGCGANFDLTSTSLGLKSMLSAYDFTVYPNPSAGIFNFTFSDTQDKTLTLYDNQGKMILEMRTNESNLILDLQSNSSGIYLIRVEVNGASHIRRLIKN